MATATAEDSTASSTEELGSGEVKFIRVNGAKLTWSSTDFEISNGTVNGFSDTGLAKAKTMAEEDELSFPEEVTNIAQNAFIYSKYENELPNGIVGKVRFHGNIEDVQDDAFRGNPDINTVILEAGGNIKFHNDSFNPARKEGKPGNTDHGEHKKFFEDVPRSSLSQIILEGPRGFTTRVRAFPRNSIKILDLTNVVGDKREIQEYVFYGSAIEEIVGTGSIELINTGAFSENELKKITVSKNVQELKHKAFQDNKELTQVVFEERDENCPVLEIHGNAFSGCNVSGTLTFNSFVKIWGPSGLGWGHPGFHSNNISKLVFSDKGIQIGWNTFIGNPIETIENLYPKSYFEFNAFSGTKTLKNISFVDFDKYEDKTIKSVPSNVFGDGLLKSVELPDHFTSIAGNAYQNNLGWIEGDTKVAVYRKNADGYVTDNAVADGDSFVINPVFVTYELKNQYGQAITKDLDLTVDVKRGADTTSDVQVAEDGNKENFKLGDSLTLKGTDIDGLTLKAVNGEEYKADTALTIDPTKTIEVIYGPDYKIGYKKFVISLTYNDPNAKDPNAVIYIEPIVPNNDTNNNNDNNSNNNNTDNTVSPSIIPNEDLSIDALPTEIVEEDIDIDGENTPLGANDIVEGEEEDLEIEGDETPLGKGKIDGKDGKKNTGILAKTGGLHVMLYQMLGLLAVLILGYFGFTFVAKKKKSER